MRGEQLENNKATGGPFFEVLTAEELAQRWLGGKARTEKLSPERRSEIARNAGLVRSQKLSADERKRIAALGGKASAGKPKTKKETV